MAEQKETKRAERLRAALRENLKRRKAQARGRRSLEKRPAKRDRPAKSNDNER
jgi:hypothetical protein